MNEPPGAPPAAPGEPPPRWVLPALVAAQAGGISPWLSSSAVLPALSGAWGLAPGDAGLLVSAVQAGFLVGTLVFALFNIADLFSPRRVFAGSALAVAALNVLLIPAGGLAQGLALRFAAGMALAGVYPVGMKIAVSWYPGRAGYVLGWMLAAGTLGSSSAYLLAGLAATGLRLPWQAVLGAASLLAAGAAALMLRVGEGPHLAPAPRLELSLAWRLFALPRYRAAALGYFGHLWELYAAWALAPLFVGAALAPLGWDSPAAVRLGAFAMVAAGVGGCLWGGAASLRLGSLRVAALALAGSGAFCVLGPLLHAVHPLLYGAGLLVWGALLIADAAQFFALAAAACPARYVGTALTVQNCLGFALTIVSIELAGRSFAALGPAVTWLLAPGPLLGLWLLLRGTRGAPAPVAG